MFSMYGYDDALLDHGHFHLDNVRVPASNMLLGPGRGFEIMQVRKCPGRIHHAMCCFGFVSSADFCKVPSRANGQRKRPFEKVLREYGSMLETNAHCRMENDTARLLGVDAAA
ncbi:acyl-CoA dehydrogenase [Exophiala aquamarina CBS 119918]|uniref:Acyl-CoA dehydrogenase n=1 Tax=Exophiala aquamarina CBS 119918 TaxID=1182545 RepID=A0A072P626_9EURO|nr:acyl-CoA dehydrogenase [Exophiala aquamarina CBS 119918]KEF51080.1 acyl-CoA dehydrogenase [Exophiala aquamarina CBS 119918]